MAHFVRMVAWFGAIATATADLGVAWVSACGQPAVRTFEVQGAGRESPLLGETVTVEAVVTADFRGVAGAFGDLDGVFVQDRSGDGDVGTSDGLFLYVGAMPVLDSTAALAPGTSVRALGLVQEYEGETQLRVEALEVCGVGAPLVASHLELPVEQVHATSGGWAADLEAMEGMLKTTPGPLRAADVASFGRNGEVTLVFGEIPWAFTHGNTPDLEAFTRYEQSLARRSLVLDDGIDTLYPAPSLADPALRLGAVWETPTEFVVRAPRRGATGMSGAYRIVALQPPRWTNPEPHPRQAPDPSSELVRIVAVNLHNLFKDGGANAECFPSFGAGDCRGETTAAGRQAHLRNSAREVAHWGADVIAASEVENDFGAGAPSTWELWVSELNAAAVEVDAGCKRYAALIPDEHHGGDAISVAIAYCEESLALERVDVPSSSQVNEWGPGVFTGPNASRLPLAATLVRRGDVRDGTVRDGTVRAISVVANHFKSRSPGVLGESCPNPRLPDCDHGDGQGYFNDARARAAHAQTQWLQSLAFTSEQAIVVAGDLNAYGREAPLTVFREQGYWLLTDADSISRPTYAYDGRLGVLDHLLISREHVGAVAAVGVLGQNVGAVPSESPFSDHDAVFVDLNLDAERVCDCDAPGALVGTPDPDVLWGTPGDDVICGLGGDDVVFGFGGRDCIDGGLGEDWALVSDLGSAGVIEAEYRLEQTAERPRCLR